MGIIKYEGVDELFRETFEGVEPGGEGTMFVQGDQAIFNSLNELSAEEASRRVAGQPYSIGAHARHLNYYLWIFNEHVRGTPPDMDWEASWDVQEFTFESWADLQTEIQEEYAFTREAFASIDEFDEEAHATWAIANIAHAAYHLGAIRALMPIVRAASGEVE